MKYDLIIIPNLSDFQNQENENKILIAPIRFETDPITGFFLKCPDCNNILSYQFSSITEEKVKCLHEKCKYVVDVDKIKVKLNS